MCIARAGGESSDLPVAIRKSVRNRSNFPAPGNADKARRP